MKNQILNGDCLTHLKELKSESVNCVMTSPPYWALRDYGVKGQLGLEPTFEEYINKLCDIFEEVKRVLRKDGTCWVNIGDTYYGGNKDNKYITSEVQLGNKGSRTVEGARFKEAKEIPDKCLTMIPFRFAIEMVNRGWILRNTIIWHKRNCMPSSVKDRFTVDFEYLFFFTKSKTYWFETQYEPHQLNLISRMKQGFNENQDYDYTKRTKKYGSEEHESTHRQGFHKNRDSSQFYNKEGRNKRTTWTINPKPFSEAHFAVYPEELCQTPIKAGCPKGGIVLDPFFGSGTTGIVALKQSKYFIGIELNKEYIEIAKKRLLPYLEQRKLQ